MKNFENKAVSGRNDEPMAVIAMKNRFFVIPSKSSLCCPGHSY
jgi:hypothetical protein